MDSRFQRATTTTSLGPIRKDDVTKKPRSHIKAVWLLLVLTTLLGRALGVPSDETPTVFRIPIEGMIDHGLAPFVQRVVDEASEIEGAVVLLDIDTFGGRVDAAVLIRDALLESPVRTVAFIHPRAISAGALISFACEDIVIAPGGSIGAATPIYSGGGTEEPTAVDEKMMSYMRTEMRTTAETRGRRGDVAEAMVDREIEIEGVVEKGKVLTLSTEEALALGIADHEAGTVDDVIEALGLSGATVLDRSLSWAESLARVVSDPQVTSILLMLGMLGIYVEIQHPGFGLPGALGALSLVTFFFGHHVAQLAGWEELLLFALGGVLVLLELLVIPGFGIAGVSGAALMFAGIVMSLLALDLRVSWDLGFLNEALFTVSTAIVGTGVAGVLLVRFLPSTRTARRMVLSETLKAEDGFSSHDEDEKERFPLGTAGEAITDLRPAGKIKIDGARIDAVTEGDFISNGARVTIIAWRSGNAVVREDA